MHDNHWIFHFDKFSIKNVMSNDEQWGIWTVFGEAEIADQFAPHVNLTYPRLQITLDGKNAHFYLRKMVLGGGSVQNFPEN